MVSGWDKNPPPEGYEPDIGNGGRLVLLAVAVLVIAGSLGWLFV